LFLNRWNKFLRIGVFRTVSFHKNKNKSKLMHFFCHFTFFFVQKCFYFVLIEHEHLKTVFCNWKLSGMHILEFFVTSKFLLVCIVHHLRMFFFVFFEALNVFFVWQKSTVSAHYLNVLCMRSFWAETFCFHLADLSLRYEFVAR